ncbi:MAG: 1-deoxy-D-xylulose-5-phosphate reductoisomerase, partial [Pseudomonadota bacterium]
MNGARTISIMGSTGSIGTSALSVVEFANAQAPQPVFAIDTLVGGGNVDLLAAQVQQFQPQHVVIGDPEKYQALRDCLTGFEGSVAAGRDAVIEAAERPVDRVLAAIVGIEGLASTLAAVEAGNSIALANKESMVCAGPLLKQRSKHSGAAIVPTDSEHNAMFQVLDRRRDLERL